jgi:hypothetical protein
MRRERFKTINLFSSLQYGHPNSSVVEEVRRTLEIFDAKQGAPLFEFRVNPHSETLETDMAELKNDMTTFAWVSVLFIFVCHCFHVRVFLSVIENWIAMATTAIKEGRAPIFSRLYGFADARAQAYKQELEQQLLTPRDERVRLAEAARNKRIEAARRARAARAQRD